LTFPVIIHVGGLNVSAHALFETLAYTIGFQVYLRTRRAERLQKGQSLRVLLGASLGALIGAKFLYWFENPELTIAQYNNLSYLLGGKTIVGGLLGGLIGVELAKKAIGVTRSTGDDFTLPLIVGMMIGRIGCFLAGLADDTAGLPTNLFTGVDFGDHIPRHPTQLYEIAFLLLLVPLILRIKKRAHPDGALFQIFMIAYLTFRLFVETIKPDPGILFGLTGIQLACVAGLVYYARKVPALVTSLRTV
jgi:phosphatidylglycerol---prolipoprotein diacylglyceryl transferase